MKKLIIFLLLLIPKMTNAQKLLGICPLSNGLVQYDTILEIDSTQKEELIERSIKWISDKYISDIQTIDKNPLNIRGKFKIVWRTSNSYHIPTIIDYKISIKFVSNKVFIQLSEFIIKWNSSPNNETFAQKWNSELDQSKIEFLTSIDDKVKSIQISLINSIKSEQI